MVRHFLRIIFPFIVSNFNLTVCAQAFSSHSVSLLPTTIETPYFDSSPVIDQITQTYYNKFKIKARFQEFAKWNTQAIKELVENGDVFEDMRTEKQYIKNIILKTLPDSLYNDRLEVRLIRDPDANAFSMVDGSCNIHVGLFRYLNNEAEFSSVLAHEFGHFHKQHGYKKYKRYKNLMISNIFLSAFSLYGLIGQYMNAAIFFKRSRNMETESDMQAVLFSRSNEYNPDGIANVQRNFLKIDKTERKKKGHKRTSNLFGTHPLTEKRIKYLTESTKDLSREGKKNFLVDSVAFSEIKKRAVDESIYAYFSSNRLDDCIELSYQQILDHPDDEFYIYFLMESLRKKITLFPFTKKQTFITERYKVKGKTPQARSIHRQLAFIYNLDSMQLKLKPASALCDASTIEFLTNDEALEYFIRISDTTCSACYSIKKRLDKSYGPTKDTLSMNDLERYLYDQTFYSKNAATSTSSCLPVFFNRSFYSVYDGSKYFTVNVTESDEFSVYLNAWKKNKNDAVLDTLFYDHLNYREKRSLSNQFETATQKLLWTNFGVKGKAKRRHHYLMRAPIKSELDLYSLCPELLLLMKKRGFDGLIFINPVYKIYRTGWVGARTEYKVRLAYYYIDAKNNKVYREYSNWKQRIRYAQDYYKVFDKMLPDLKKFKKRYLSTKI